MNVAFSTNEPQLSALIGGAVWRAEGIPAAALSVPAASQRSIEKVAAIPGS
ncbi:hypothetical protein OK016_17065 [Vibrio chagasii]|nr:hypothetical protein [Vibrio chagasii]